MEDRDSGVILYPGSSIEGARPECADCPVARYTLRLDRFWTQTLAGEQLDWHREYVALFHQHAALVGALRELAEHTHETSRRAYLALAEMKGF